MCPEKLDRLNDHKRPTSPTDAILAGADYLVVGRPIKDSNDPKQVAAEIISDMQAAFDQRTY